jgi:putative NADH-flavin reductase
LKIALIGASGMIGSRLLQEALRRKHTVVAIVRDSGKLPQSPSIVPSATDVLDSSALTAAIRGTEAVIYAFNSPKEATLGERVDAQRRAILSALAAATRCGVDLAEPFTQPGCGRA